MCGPLVNPSVEDGQTTSSRKKLLHFEARFGTGAPGLRQKVLIVAIPLSLFRSPVFTGANVMTLGHFVLYQMVSAGRVMM